MPVNDKEEFSLKDTGFVSMEDKDSILTSDGKLETLTGDTFMDALGNPRDERVKAFERRRDDLTSKDDGTLDVLGMPLRYNGLADPNKRVFTKSYENDLPLVFMLPGLPRIQKRAFGKKGEGGIFNFGENANNILNAAVSMTAFGMTNTKDGRLVTVNPNIAEYLETLSTMASQVYVSMGLEGTFDIYDYIFSSGHSKYGIAYFANKGTSISESAMNEYTSSMLASEVNSKNQEIREQRMMAQAGGAGIIKGAAEALRQFIDDTVEGIPILGGMIGNMLEHLNGQKLYYPDLWSNSLYDRMYNVEFRFHSPYGDRASIFRHVYFPFLSVMAMALPLHDGIFSYKQPFMIKANCPGRFEVEAGYIQSMNVVRGEEQTWTADGFPREINVSLNIRDLYPTLYSSATHQRLKYNKGLISYLESLGGIRYDQLSILSKIDKDINARLGSGGKLLPRYHVNKLRDVSYSIRNARNLFG